LTEELTLRQRDPKHNTPALVLNTYDQVGDLIPGGPNACPADTTRRRLRAGYVFPAAFFRASFASYSFSQFFWNAEPSLFSYLSFFLWPSRRVALA
jgi:hypothetical protein